MLTGLLRDVLSPFIIKRRTEKMGKVFCSE